MRHRSGTPLPAGEQRSRAAGTDVQSQQLRQLAADRDFPALRSLAAPDRDDALRKTDILDSQLH
jgi:hypothetical protein